MAKKGRDLKFSYDKKKLTITLDRSYQRTEQYQVRIQYVAKPNELPKGGSAAITDDKGLYFINPLGNDKGKPRQIWTQGETEGSSCWFPTIDRPNQRMTQEISLTVEGRSENAVQRPAGIVAPQPRRHPHRYLEGTRPTRPTWP